MMKDQGCSANKYKAEKTNHFGMRFDSKLESSVYALYKLMEKAGEISNLRHQHQTYFTKSKIGWRLDFSFIREGELCFGEAKGLETEGYMIKKKLWPNYGLGPIEVWKGTAQAPRLVETIIPIEGAELN